MPIKNILNIIMAYFICDFLRHSIIVVRDYKTSPELYAVQSAPWYSSILFYGAITFLVVGVGTLIKVVLNHIEKKNQK